LRMITYPDYTYGSGKHIPETRGIMRMTIRFLTGLALIAQLAAGQDAAYAGENSKTKKSETHGQTNPDIKDSDFVVDRFKDQSGDEYCAVRMVNAKEMIGKKKLGPATVNSIINRHLSTQLCDAANQAELTPEQFKRGAQEMIKKNYGWELDIEGFEPSIDPTGKFFNLKFNPGYFTPEQNTEFERRYQRWVKNDKPKKREGILAAFGEGDLRTKSGSLHFNIHPDQWFEIPCAAAESFPQNYAAEKRAEASKGRSEKKQEESNKYSCTGKIPKNSVACAGELEKLVNNAKIELVEKCSEAKKCEYSCDKDSTYIEGACLDAATLKEKDQKRLQDEAQKNKELEKEDKNIQPPVKDEDKATSRFYVSASFVGNENAYDKTKKEGTAAKGFLARLGYRINDWFGAGVVGGNISVKSNETYDVTEATNLAGDHTIDSMISKEKSDIRFIGIELDVYPVRYLLIAPNAFIAKGNKKAETSEHLEVNGQAIGTLPLEISDIALKGYGAGMTFGAIIGDFELIGNVKYIETHPSEINNRNFNHEIIFGGGLGYEF